MKIGGVFSGIGGIELGFEKAGFEVVWANEIDKNACKTYRFNHSHKLYECDIRELNKKFKVDNIDILVGGFPCQAFSVAGYQKGFCDPRGNIFFEIIRLVDELSPNIIFLENVKNLKNHDNGKTYKTIENLLTSRGYYIKAEVLNSSEYGNVPQNRERIYIIAFKDKNLYNNFQFPKPIKLTTKIIDILDKEVDGRFYYNNSKYYPMLKRHITKRNTIYQLRRTYVRENKSNLCPTLTANMGTGGHNVPLILDDKDIRKLTPNECAKFQGYDNLLFPDDLALSHRYKQIGNSVTITVIERIAKEIKKAIKCANMSMNLKSAVSKRSA